MSEKNPALQRAVPVALENAPAAEVSLRSRMCYVAVGPAGRAGQRSLRFGDLGQMDDIFQSVAGLRSHEQTAP